MLPRLIAFAVTSGLAKRAWDHYRDGRRRNRPLQDITEVVARPAAAAPEGKRTKAASTGRKSEGPGA